MITLKEIAEICGVSVMTVSNVVNGRSKASKETQEKILQAVKETGYIPNYVARGLRNKKTKTIALIAEDIAQFTSPYIIEGVVSCCEEAGYRVIMQNLRLYARWSDTWYNETTSFLSVLEPALQEAVSVHADGIIYIAGHSREINCFDHLNVPVVMAHAYSGSNKVPSVVLDDEKSAYEVVKYLIDKGHKRIGVVAGRADNTHTILRLKGYKKALEDNKITYDSKLISNASWDVESAYNATREIVKEDITAIFCMSDHMAGGVYDYLQEHDIRIGKDISVASFDNAELSKYMTPKLTTTAMPLPQMGAIAAGILLEMMKDENSHRHDAPEVIRIPCEFIERNSVSSI